VGASYRIVPASAAHIAAIPAIEQAAATLFSEEDLPAGIRYRVTDAETLRDAQRDGRIWMAVDRSGVPVGFSIVTFMDGNPHLDEMDVLPSHGRNGIGSMLLQRVVETAKADGYDVLTLVTFRHIPWNAPFYARRGFEALPGEKIGSEIRALLAEEQAAGIDAENRQAMILRLQ